VIAALEIDVNAVGYPQKPGQLVEVLAPVHNHAA